MLSADPGTAGVGGAAPRPDGLALTVLGIGNPLAGDDGVGLALADVLAAGGLPEGVVVRAAGSDPLALLEELLAGRRVVLLDACRSGGRPGEAMWMRLDDPRWPAAAAPLSLHGLDLPTVFQLAGALGLPLERAWLFGVEPDGALEGRGLSRAVTEALPQLAEVARRGVRCLLDGLAPTEPAAASAAGRGA